MIRIKLRLLHIRRNPEDTLVQIAETYHRNKMGKVGRIKRFLNHTTDPGQNRNSNSTTVLYLIPKY